MSNPVVSVIVPVYNKARWVEECLDSILAQSYTDFELIIVDDGSSDGSGGICDRIARHDSRVRVIHKPNGGVSAARNDGMSAASGDWIAFVDADDTLGTDYLMHLAAEAHDCDIVSDSDLRQTTVYKDRDIVKYVDTLGRSQIGTSVWGKLYKRTLLQQSGAVFDPDFNFGEDTLFNLHVWGHCDAIKAIPYMEYHYRDAGANRYGFDCDALRRKIAALKAGYGRIGARFGVTVPVMRDINITVSLYPLDKVLEDGEDEYRALYFENFPQADEATFYNDMRCSPIIRSITEAKILRRECGWQAAMRLLLRARRRYGRRFAMVRYPFRGHAIIGKIIGLTAVI